MCARTGVFVYSQRGVLVSSMMVIFSRSMHMKGICWIELNQLKQSVTGPWLCNLELDLTRVRKIEKPDVQSRQYLHLLHMQSHEWPGAGGSII